MRAFNLIPPDQRRGAGGIAGRTGGVVYVVLGGLVALVVMGTVYALAVHQTATRRTTLAQIADEQTTITAQAASLQPYVDFRTLSQERIADVAELAAQRFDWPLAMQQIALALPSSVTLSALSGTASGGLSTASSGSTDTTGTTGSTGATDGALGVVVNAPTLTISGCAHGTPSSAQDAVATTLARLRALQDVTSATVSTYATGGCDGVTFDASLIYGSAYGIPSGHLTAAQDTTVGG